MPTGYLAQLYDGEVEFDDFVLKCARAFGAAIMLRDHDGRVVPTEENVRMETEHYEKQLAADEAKLVTLRNLTVGQAASRAAETFKKRHDAWLKEKEVVEKRRARYTAMRAEVRAWSPPALIEPLKAFMLEQIDDSGKYDCLIHDEPVEKNYQEWRSAEIESVERSIAYHQEQIEKYEELNAERSEWVRELYESLGLAPTPTEGAAT